MALLGANGAGKSTLLAAVSGALSAQRGTIRLEGREIQRLRSDAIVRRGVALVPERRDLFPDMTVMENLEMGAYRARTRPPSAPISPMCWSGFRCSPSAGVSSPPPSAAASSRCSAIGRAVMLRPRLLLLDEPSLGVAPLILEKIFDIVQRINRLRGTTILLVEQNTMIALAVAARAYVLETGRIVASGTSAELKASDTIRRSYLGDT